MMVQAEAICKFLSHVGNNAVDGRRTELTCLTAAARICGQGEKKHAWSSFVSQRLHGYMDDWKLLDERSASLDASVGDGLFW